MMTSGYAIVKWIDGGISIEAPSVDAAKQALEHVLLPEPHIHEPEHDRGGSGWVRVRVTMFSPESSNTFRPGGFHIPLVPDLSAVPME
jgi:hypothetical protein